MVSATLWRVLRQTIETACAITSLLPEAASAEELLTSWRGHWSIATRLHYVRDVTLGEDACRVRSGAAPQAPAVAAAPRRFAARPAEALAAIGITTVLNHHELCLVEAGQRAVVEVRDGLVG